MIIPLVPALLLALFSFISSVFVILRIIIPILPPNPLSRRVPPSEFGLPNFRTLSLANKSHIWLASLDILALVIFIWQAINESLWGQTQFADSIDPASSARLWFALTLRQTCLLLVAAISLLHIRLGQPVSFGSKQWMLWVPTLLIVCLSTSLAAVLSSAYVPSLFIGLIAFSSSVAILSTIVFICLLITVIAIKRNLTAIDDRANPWPPMKDMEEKPRPSFATEDIDALRDGASWITSEAGSRRNSTSAWSFSTYHTAAAHGSVRNHPATGSHPSLPSRSSFWFNPLSSVAQVHAVPPVPPLPSPYRSHSAQTLGNDPDPFRRDIPTPSGQQRIRHGSQSSWLTSPSVSQATLSAWSYPTSHHSHTGHGENTPDPLVSSIRPVTPALANAQVLGGYGYALGPIEAEKGLPASATSGCKIEASVYHTLAWLVIIWLPLLLSFPYLITAFPTFNVRSPVVPVLFVLSVTISSPLLAFSILIRSPIPIPSGLFESQSGIPSGVMCTGSPASTIPGLPTAKFSHEYKRSGSITVVEGRRSGDVWIDNGDAVDGKSKISRVLGMIVPKPRLIVLPSGEAEGGEVTPPLPMQLEDSPAPTSLFPVAAPTTPQSEMSVEMGRVRKNSKASSYFSGGDESLAYASRIMIAQRHYSAMAHTVVVPATPESGDSIGAKHTLDIVKATGAVDNQTSRPTSHLRARSVSWASGPQTPTAGTFHISPPPSFPLPPTPPNVRAARLAQLGHKKSFSSGFSFGAVDDVNEIDALTAGVLPLLVPGLKVGPDMRIKPSEWDSSPPVTLSKANKAVLQTMNAEFGGLEGDEFSSPEVHSTPARKKPQAPRTSKTSSHKKNHFSLPSLSLGKEGIHSLASWKAEISRALENQIGKYTGTLDPSRRATVIGGESVHTGLHLEAVQEENEAQRPLVARTGGNPARSLSTRSLGLNADVPQNVDTARSSIATLNAAPPSAASTVTLFDFDTALDSGPQAESTPHNSLSQKQVSKPKSHPSPIPEQPPITTRRSSIAYIKSDDNEASLSPNSTTAMPSTSTRLSQWSSRAMRPLIPKASKLQRKNSNLNSSKLGSPSGGLRQLTLLKDRDTNAVPSVHDTGALGTTQPLSLGKKQKTRRAVINDENASIDAGSQNRNLKPLQLVRSETSKMRGILRKEEVLPDVVVRPPSETEHTAFAYTFAI